MIYDNDLSAFKDMLDKAEDGLGYVSLTLTMEDGEELTVRCSHDKDIKKETP